MGSKPQIKEIKNNKKNKSKQMEKGKNKKINATQRKVLESIWHPTFSAGIMNLKTLLPLLFCGLRHHLSEFHRSRTILQIVDNCLSLSLSSSSV